MTTDPADLPAFGAASLVAQSLRQLVAQMGRLFPYAFVAALVVTVLGRWTSDAGTAAFDPAASPLSVFTPTVLLVVLAWTLFSVAASGVLILVALDALLGTRHGLGQYVSQALRRILPLAVLTTLYGVAVGLASVFLIVPGLYVAARFYPLIPAVVFEDRGWSGLTRARDLTQGYRWAIAALILLVVVIAVVLVVGGGLVFGAIQPVGGGIAFLGEVILNALSLAYTAILGALVYLRLRELNEGMSRADVAANIG